jgi:hypothetical protein
VICVSGENRIPPGSWPYVGHSLEAAELGVGDWASTPKPKPSTATAAEATKAVIRIFILDRILLEKHVS